jgi:putative phage-type endonuclease
MTAVLLGDFAPDSPEWHAARRNGLGASEIAAVVGLSPFESPFSLWHRKKGNIPGPDPSNPLFYWGHALEPVVAQKFAEQHPEFKLGHQGTCSHSERPWQLANLDRSLHFGNTVEPDAVLEIKTTRYGDNWGPSGSDQIPIHVRCQVMQQMDVFDAPYAWVAVLIGGNDYREYRIDYDPEDAIALREAGAAFWASIEADDEPPIDATWETYEAVRELHPEIDCEDVPIDPVLYESYAQSKAIAEAANDAHRQAKSALLKAMGNARRALVNDTPVLRRQPARNGSVALYPVKDAS